VTKTNKKQLLLTTLLSGVTFGAAAAPSFAQTTDEIVVTGTRVERQNLEAPSPVTSIDSEALSVANTINTEQFINSLPQVVPAFDGTSNNPGTGTATVSLRGLGSNRTLVLVDGFRFVSANGDGVVDLNSIPASLVKRVDIVTGGASAVYGSDAMAGVVNFVLDDEFEGIEVDGSYEMSDRGDAGIKNVGVTLGGNFDNGRGNATVYAGYSQRDAVFQGEREFSAIANDDNGTGFDPFGSSGVPGTRLFANFDFADGTRGGATFDPEGNIIPWINSGPNTTRYNYAPVNYLQLPQERYSLAAFGTYDITDTVTAKVKGMFTSNTVPQELAPTPFFSSVTIDTVNNPFLNDAARASLAGEAGDDGLLPVFIGRRMLEIGPRTNDQELQSFQVSGDLSGQWSEDWDWDIHAHLARSSGAIVQTGNVSISAFQDVVLNGTCNIFGEGNFSQECVDLVARTGAATQVSEQRSVVATTDGPVKGIVSPMAENPLSLVGGVEYRQEDFDFRPDSVLGPDVSGFNQSLPVKGDFNTYEVFGEAYLPLIEGAAFAEELSLNGAYRYSDYSTVGGVSSYAVGLEWAPVSDVRFRGQIQRSVRAPNVQELFAPQTNGFPGATDPCAQPGASAIAALCQATGVPAASVGDSAIQPNSQTEGLFGGNPDLAEETSDTITLGFVAQPSAIPGLTLTVDYYNIDVDDAIGTAGIQTVLDNCYNGVVPEFCGLINRLGNGQIDNVELTNQNVAFLGSEGIDVEVDYSFDAPGVIGGEFGLNIIGGYKISDEFQALAITELDDCTGFMGGRAGVCGEPSPEWKHTASLRHVKGPVLTTLRWRYLSNVRVDDPLRDLDPSELFANETGAKNYFDLSSQWDISDHFQISGGIINAFDVDPPVLGDCCSEQANTYPATYNPFGRKFFVGGKMRF
jgi:outer membrane receptor protein involved in Fe transport